jgi:glutamate synthase (NADPH/NADH) small chain
LTGRRVQTCDDGERLSPAAIAENFADLHAPLSEPQSVIDAARCLYCYDAPCVAACPTSIDIPKFIHQLRSGNVDGAARTILSANIMGGTCARACPTEVLCEEACVVNHAEGAPVKIGLLQRHAVDRLMAKGGAHPFRRAKESGRRLAVVGAGPAGLSFAHRAALLGHSVTVFEREPTPGGLNEFGLAAYKMVDDFAQKEIAFLLGVGGVDIRTGVTLGRDIALDALRREYDAVFIGAGLSAAATLGIPGNELSGVRDALGFIADLRRARDKSDVAIGRRIVVIGGGNTAIDAAIQSRRLGARQVTLVYRRGREDMPATAYEQSLAAASGVAFRLWAAPVAFRGACALKSVEFAATRLDGDQLETTNERFEISSDMALVAIGQKLNARGLEGLKIENGKIAVGSDYQTSVPGVYAGGDCIAGEDLTVQAVEDGKRAAIAVDAALKAQGGKR